MKALKKFLGTVAVFLSLATAGGTAHAGIPVIDAANLAQAIQQVTAWAQQYGQMAQQIQQLQTTYQNQYGIRNMASLVNNPGSRQYLPSDYQTILNQGVGQWQAIYNLNKKFDLADTTLNPNSDGSQAFNARAKQVAINRAGAETAYNTASQRFSDIQVLLDKVNNTPDAKDIADLQGRIQAEQVMMQNEANKLQMLAQLSSAQRELHDQQVRELGMKASKGPMPAGW